MGSALIIVCLLGLALIGFCAIVASYRGRGGGPGR